MNESRGQGAVEDVAGYAEDQVSDWTGETNAQLERLRQQAKWRAERAIGSGKDTVREAQTRVRARADAWGRFEEAVRERMEEAEFRHDAQQPIYAADIDPLRRSGSWVERIYSSHR
jgi:uncharacterized protein YjbJ (UPF0337 family)